MFLYHHHSHKHSYTNGAGQHPHILPDSKLQQNWKKSNSSETWEKKRKKKVKKKCLKIEDKVLGQVWKNQYMDEWEEA